MIQVYHNPRCGKSRECVLKLTNDEKDFEIVNYLQNPPTPNDLKILLEKLDLKPIDLVRKKEPIWIENFKTKQLSDTQIIQAMSDFPILIERPIVINGNRAVIARPASNADAII